MDAQALAIANNDLVYLWWTYPEKIDGCLGFSIRRLAEGEQPRALPAFVGFQAAKPDADGDREQSTTDFWPIQSYQWKDLFVPEDTEVSYEIVPMTGTPGDELEEMPGLAVRSNPVTAAEAVGSHRVVFNRGIISTQALSRRLPAGPSGIPSEDALREHIAQPGDAIRTGLAGEALGALTSLFERARAEGGRCYCALYELTDPELAAAIVAAKGSVEVVLANANKSIVVDGHYKTVYDGTNAANRALVKAALGDALHDRMLVGASIGHNKFVVWVDDSDTPRAVVTGSTNWTPTGLCAQTNNVLVIEDEAIATRYRDYWNSLLGEGNEQGASFRADNAEEPPNQSLGDEQGSARVWFSPNTRIKTVQTDEPPPPDIQELFAAIDGAEHGVLFLLFHAGTPSILTHLEQVSQQRLAERRALFVRGAISNSVAAEEFATRIYNDSLLDAPNRLITGIAGIRDTYSYWVKELAQLGHAVIHDKILVVDPFTDGCLVATGSHNLGYKASYANDENMCLIRGNRRLAEAYTAHILDVVNHFNWRYKLLEQRENGVSPEDVYYDLDEDDRWQDKYFTGSFLKSRDRFFFPQPG